MLLKWFYLLLFFWKYMHGKYIRKISCMIWKCFLLPLHIAPIIISIFYAIDQNPKVPTYAYICTHKDLWTQNLHSDTFSVRFLTIIRWSSFSKYLQIRNMKAENLLWGWFFQFLCCSIFIFFEDFSFLLHKELNFSVFSDKILFGVVSCRMRFHTSW